MQLPNIQFVTKLDSLAFKTTPSYSRSVPSSYTGTVYHAFEKFLTPEELDEIVNGYHRSTWSEDALQVDIDKLNSPHHAVIKDEHYHAALQEMDKRFKPETPLLPVHFADLRLYPWNLSPNIGAPFNVSETWKQYVVLKYTMNLIANFKMSKHNLYNEAFFINRYKIHLIKDGHVLDQFGNNMHYFNTAFARLHLVQKDKSDKVRLVFGAPWLLLMAEAMFIWPIQISLLSKGINSPLLWGFETITGGWYRLRNYFSTEHPSANTFFTFDWSGFDRYARHSVIHDIHSIWRSWFTFEKGYWPTNLYPDSHETDPARLQNLWNWLCNAITKTPLLLPDGKLISFLHSGIFSGYLQTQLLDSCYNFVMMLTILSRMGFDITQIALKVQGDDSIGALLERLTPARRHQFIELVKYYGKLYFGAELNDKATEISDTLEDLEVLSYRNTNGIPYRNPLKLLAMLYYPERSQSLPKLMARSIGIAYANCGFSTPVYLICEDIFFFLKSQGHSPDVEGLPPGIAFTKSELSELRDFVDVTRFPTYMETIQNLTSHERQFIDNRHWNQDHFIGTPK